MLLCYIIDKMFIRYEEFSKIVIIQYPNFPFLYIDLTRLVCIRISQISRQKTDLNFFFLHTLRNECFFAVQMAKKLFGMKNSYGKLNVRKFTFFYVDPTRLEYI